MNSTGGVFLAGSCDEDCMSRAKISTACRTERAVCPTRPKLPSPDQRQACSLPKRSEPTAFMRCPCARYETTTSRRDFGDRCNSRTGCGTQRAPAMNHGRHQLTRLHRILPIQSRRNATHSCDKRSLRLEGTCRAFPFHKPQL